MNLVDRVKHTANGIRILKEWLGEGSVTVSRELAQQRANICLKCPKNQKGNMVTKAVAWAIKEQTDLKSDLGLRVEGEKGLQTCAVCTCWLRLKIWLPMDKLRSEKDPEEFYPDFCWMKNEP